MTKAHYDCLHVQKDGQNQLEKAINAHNLYMQIVVSVPLALRKHIAKIQAQLEIKDE